MCFRPILLNGNLSPDRNATVGNAMTVTCADGFRIAGSSNNNVTSTVFLCMAYGTWNGTIDCEPKGM